MRDAPAMAAGRWARKGKPVNTTGTAYEFEQHSIYE
jgi:hypothetical protein